MRLLPMRKISRHSKRLALFLTFCAGYVDAYTFIERGNTLVAGQTGNVVFLSVGLVQQNVADVEEKVMRAAYEVINRKRATYYAIGIALFTIVKAILRDENVELAVSGYCDGHYGIDGLYIGTPAIVGREGVREVVELELNEDEKAKMLHSAKVLKETLENAYAALEA